MVEPNVRLEVIYIKLADWLTDLHVLDTADESFGQLSALDAVSLVSSLTEIIDNYTC